MSDISIKLSNSMANLIKLDAPNFKTVKDAQDAAKNIKGNEVIVKNDDGSFSLYSMDKQNEGQILEMAKKGNTADFDPRIVAFMKTEAFSQEKRIDVNDASSEAGLSGKVKGENIKDFVDVKLASQAEVNKFTSIDNAKEAAKVRGDSITAIVLNDDGSFSLFDVNSKDKMTSVLDAASKTVNGETSIYNKKVMAFVENTTSLFGAKTSNATDVAGAEDSKKTILDNVAKDKEYLSKYVGNSLNYSPSLSLNMFNKPMFGLNPSVNSPLGLNLSLDAFGLNTSLSTQSELTLKTPSLLNSSLDSIGLGGFDFLNLSLGNTQDTTSQVSSSVTTKEATLPEVKLENFYNIDDKGQLTTLDSSKLNAFFAGLENIDVSKYKDVLGEDITKIFTDKSLQGKIKDLLNNPNIQNDNNIKTQLNTSLASLNTIASAIQSGKVNGDILNGLLKSEVTFVTTANDDSKKVHRGNISNLIQDLSFGADYSKQFEDLAKNNQKAISLPKFYEICSNAEQVLIAEKEKELKSKDINTNGEPIIIPRKELFTQVSKELTNELTNASKVANVAQDKFGTVLNDKNFMNGFKASLSMLIDRLEEKNYPNVDLTNLNKILDNSSKLSSEDLINQVYAELDKLAIANPAVSTETPATSTDKSTFLTSKGYFEKNVETLKKISSLEGEQKKNMEDILKTMRDIKTSLMGRPESKQIRELIAPFMEQYEATLNALLQNPNDRDANIAMALLSNNFQQIFDTLCSSNTKPEQILETSKIKANAFATLSKKLAQNPSPAELEDAINIYFNTLEKENSKEKINPLLEKRNPLLEERTSILLMIRNSQDLPVLKGADVDISEKAASAPLTLPKTGISYGVNVATVTSTGTTDEKTSEESATRISKKASPASSVFKGMEVAATSFSKMLNVAKVSEFAFVQEQAIKLLKTDTFQKFLGQNSSLLNKALELYTAKSEYNTGTLNLTGKTGVSTETIKSVGDSLSSDYAKLLQFHDINNEYMGSIVNDLIEQAQKLTDELDLSVNVDFTSADLLKSFRDIIAKLDFEIRSENQSDAMNKTITDSFLTYLKDNKDEQDSLDKLREKLLNLDVTKGVPTNLRESYNQVINFLNKLA